MGAARRSAKQFFDIPGVQQPQGDRLDLGAGHRCQWQVSNQGGIVPKWRRDGKELYYVGVLRTNIMAAGIRVAGAGIQTDAPRELFTIPGLHYGADFPYDVTADGERFLLPQSANATQRPAPLTVVLNWQASLKQ